jgi:COQ9
VFLQFAWYTDRSVLAGAFHATEIFWLTDKSPGQTETWRFLARGLRDAHNLRDGASAAAGKVGGLADAAMSTLATLLRSSRKSY